MEAAYEELNRIKQLDMAGLQCRLWVVKRRLAGGEAVYTTVSANIHGLDADFRNALSDFLVAEIFMSL